ncbi:HlyD family efflux transporter periplasmic adaptor subunit [Gallaecimonas kandeliae]|uniref:HlyD family secretion protein n=1 Tax=Gallaecimonas kandeliae TaxID=3029055 RepID=UPI002647B15F|nr:HlyD family efflux transporter periplasmic adaptor subunit [Gallaecimonas kandeliae]WKE64389.1 HlyD family efflux transporter periplasmic adaptor subunit [Gallaecimonas kandeliae]
MRKGLVLAALVVAALAVWLGQHWLLKGSPEGFASGNGRIEAVELDVASKYGGRLDQLLVNEGDFVTKGQILARMDSATLEAQLRQAQAKARQAGDNLLSAQAQVEQAQSQLNLAELQYKRAKELLAKKLVARAQYDEAESGFQVAKANVTAAKARAVAAKGAIDEAEAGVDSLQSQLDETVLRAPRDGRIQYRLANVGEVLGAGGRVLTLLDLTDVTMSIFLPQTLAGKLALGSEARIVLDVIPDKPIPATVSFVASDAQFTPKQVETQDEREKLMFRVKVRIPKALLEAHIQQVKTGLPGVAWVRLDATKPWPANLETPFKS